MTDANLEDLARYHPALFELVIEIAGVTGHVEEDQAKFANWAQKYPLKKEGEKIPTIWEGAFQSFEKTLPVNPSREALTIAKKMATLSGQRTAANTYTRQLEGPHEYVSLKSLIE